MCLLHCLIHAGTYYCAVLKLLNMNALPLSLKQTDQFNPDESCDPHLISRVKSTSISAGERREII